MLTPEQQEKIKKRFDAVYRGAVERGGSLAEAAQYTAVDVLGSARQFPEVTEILVEYQIAGAKKNLEEIRKSTTSTASPATAQGMGAATSTNTPATLKVEMAKTEPAANEQKVQPETKPPARVGPPATAQLGVQSEFVKPSADPLTLVPAELKAKPNWVRWVLEPDKNGNLTKPPYQLNGDKASYTDPSTWNTFEAVTKGVISNTQGVGICLDENFIAFDLDGCRNPETGEFTDWAKRIMTLLGGYWEVTPSGYGIRGYAFGKLPAAGPCRLLLATSAGYGDKVRIDVFRGIGYVTVTGNRISTASSMESPNVLRTYELCCTIAEEFPSEKRKQASQFGGNDSDSTVVFTQASGTTLTSKLAVLMYGKITNPKHPFEIQDEWGNKVSSDTQSEADLSLVTLLAIKHDGDTELIDSDFRESALYRSKWEPSVHKSYQKLTIAKAIATAQRIKERESEKEKNSEQFTSTPNLEVREIEEPEESSSPLVLPHSALTSTVLGDLYDQVFAPNGWPMEFALPSLATDCSVLVPRRESQGTILVEPPLTQLYTGLIGPVNVGKSQIIEWGAKSVGIFADERNEHYVQVKFGSAEQMWKYLHMFSKGVSSAPNAFHTAVLINPDEWSHVMAKAGIPDASFASNLTTAFNKLRHNVTLGGQGGGRPVEIQFPFSIIGGIVDTEFGNTYSANTVGGLYDRMLFGVAPEGFDWAYRPFPYHHPFFRGGKMALNPVPVDIQPDVWELTKAWKNQDKGLTRIIEIAVRVATIFASMDGRTVLTAKDVEKMWGFVTYEKNVRGLFLPNPGVNPDAVYANAALAWIKLHARQWRTFKELKDGTNYYRRQLGPYVCTRTLQALTKDNEIDMWVSGLNKEGKLNPMPADYQGKRPKIHEGLVRVAASGAEAEAA